MSKYIHPSSLIAFEMLSFDWSSRLRRIMRSANAMKQTFSSAEKKLLKASEKTGEDAVKELKRTLASLSALSEPRSGIQSAGESA